MAASLIVGSPYDFLPEFMGTQMDIRAAQRVRLTLAGSQTVNQPGALTATQLLAGSCLGVVTATGKAVLVNSQATDGSQTLVAILSRDVETASADVVVSAYITGSFLASELLGGTDTVNTHFSKWTGRHSRPELYSSNGAPRSPIRPGIEKPASGRRSRIRFNGLSPVDLYNGPSEILPRSQALSWCGGEQENDAASHRNCARQKTRGI